MSPNFRNEEGQKEDMMLGAEAELIENRPANLRFCVGVPVKSHVTVKLDDGDGRLVLTVSMNLS